MAVRSFSHVLGMFRHCKHQRSQPLLPRTLSSGSFMLAGAFAGAKTQCYTRRFEGA